MKFLRQLTAATCLTVFVLLLSSQNAQAQESNDEGPSLQETIDWLKSKLNGQKVEYTESTVGNTGASSFKSTEEYTNFRADGCTVRWTMKNVFDDTPYSYDLDLKLSDLDPVSVKVETLEPEVSKHMNTRVRGSGISPETWLVVLKVTAFQGNTFKTGFKFQDREMAKRVAKAFQNAIKKCGGKVEPF